jgi:NDP-hexose 4-ketoreductase
VYGVTKLAATQLVTLARHDGLLEALTLRVFNPIGAGISPNTLPGRVALALREAMRLGRGEITTGPLGAFRDFVDVREVARAVMAAVTASELPHGPLNVGSGLAVRSRAMVAQLAMVAGFTGQIVERDAGSPRSSDVNWQQADLTRSRAALAWSPQLPLRDSLEALWQSVLLNSPDHKPLETVLR